MTKRIRSATRSEEKRQRMKEEAFLKKYGYQSDIDSFFQNFKTRKSEAEDDQSEED